MGKFQVGQWVRRVEPSDWPEQYGVVGEVYKVLKANPHSIVVIEGQSAATAAAFEPWTPRVGERVVLRSSSTWACTATEGPGTVYPNDKSDRFTVKFDGDNGFPWSLASHDLEPLPVATEPQAKFQIEAGKFYKTRDGRKAGPSLPYEGSPKEYCWRVPTDGLGHFVYTSDGRYSTDGYWPENDLVSEWVEPASNDNAPVAKQPAAKPPKFKVGDRVRCLKSYPEQFTEGKIYTVSRDCSGREYESVSVARDDMDSTTNGWNHIFFELVTAPTPTAIVALIENGKPKPAVRPHVHASAELAQKEADRLANKFKGKQFGVYVLSSISEQAKPVYDHKWQRLAADGLKIDAIKELRGITGMGLKPAKDAVEYFLQAA